MGQKPVPPVNIRFNPTTKIGSKMGGEFTYQPKWDPKTALTTTAISLQAHPRPPPPCLRFCSSGAPNLGKKVQAVPGWWRTKLPAAPRLRQPKFVDFPNIRQRKRLDCFFFSEIFLGVASASLQHGRKGCVRTPHHLVRIASSCMIEGTL